MKDDISPMSNTLNLITALWLRKMISSVLKHRP